MSNLCFPLVNLHQLFCLSYSADLGQISVCCPDMSEQAVHIEFSFNISLSSPNN